MNDEMTSRWPKHLSNVCKKRLSHQFIAGEALMFTAEANINSNLQFERIVICLTNYRLIALTAEYVESWHCMLSDKLRIGLSEQSGIGYFEVFDEQSRLAYWCFTLEQKLQFLQLVELFKLQIKLQDVGNIRPINDFNYCPECKALLDNELGDCFNCLHSTEKYSSPKTLIRLWPFARSYRWHLMTGFGLMLASIGAGLVPPYLMIPIMDNVLIPAQQGAQLKISAILYYLLAMLLSSLCAWGLSWGKTYVLTLASERIGSDLRSKTFSHLMTLSFEYFSSRRTGDLIARISTHTDRICAFLSGQFLDFCTDLFMLIMTAIVLIYLDPKMAMFALLPVPAVLCLVNFIRNKLRIGFDKADRVWSDLIAVLSDTIPGVRVVKGFAQERKETKRFAEVNSRNFDRNNRINKVWSIFLPTVTLVNEIGLLLLWGFGIYQVMHGVIKVGVLSAFVAYTGRFLLRVESLGRIVSAAHRTVASTRRIFDILDHKPQMIQPEDTVSVATIKGEIEFRQVSFRFGTRLIIEDINLHIKPGEMIGLVGHSGAGKSTLVNLICRFYDISVGVILVDGVGIQSFNIQDYRRRIGVVSQDPLLFYGTIAENIAYGKPDANLSDIIRVARAARAHEFIMRLPFGYDSLVGERGHNLSGGERQRIAIARALLIDPPILILDEATSAVDSETEHEIQIALENLIHGRTTIAIAHRLSTLHRADRIVVLDRGKIVEMGDHHALLNNKSMYYHLYNIQANNFIIDL